MAKRQYYFQKKTDEKMEAEDREALNRFLIDAPPGRWRIDFVKERKPKSQPQLGYIFGGIVDAIIYECNENRQDGVDSLLKYIIDADVPKGQPATVDLVKDLLYAVAPTYDDKNRKRTLSGMDTGQAAHFTERILNIFANFVQIDSPEEFKAKLEQNRSGA